jgi:hypothetical protein
MIAPINRKLSLDSEWKEWSNYVLITLEKLSEELTKRDKERAVFKEKMLMDLMVLREFFISKISESEKMNRKNVDEVIVKIESMISDVSSNHTKLSDKFITFNENVVMPLRIKLAVLSIVGGAVGGTIVYVVTPLLVRLMTGS